MIKIKHENRIRGGYTDPKVTILKTSDFRALLALARAVDRWEKGTGMMDFYKRNDNMITKLEKVRGLGK